MIQICDTCKHYSRLQGMCKSGEIPIPAPYTSICGRWEEAYDARSKYPTVTSIKFLIDRITATCDGNNQKGKYMFKDKRQLHEVFAQWVTPQWADTGDKAYYYFSVIRRLKALGAEFSAEEIEKAIHELVILRSTMVDDAV